MICSVKISALVIGKDFRKMSSKRTNQPSPPSIINVFIFLGTFFFCMGTRYVKAFARRSVANEELQKWQDAFEDLKKSLELDPSLRAKEWHRIHRHKENTTWG